MKFNLARWARNSSLTLLLVSLVYFCATTAQAVMAHRVATATVASYAPTWEKQGVAIVIAALPKTEDGDKAAHLTEALAGNVERQYSALSRAVQTQADTLTHQALAWAAVSILAGLAYFESRRRTSIKAAGLAAT